MKKVLLILWGFVLATSCGTGVDSRDKPVISVSIIPQQYFIEQLAGELVEVNVLIPPGASPATYEPTLAQLGKLEQSDIYMRIGYVGFEQSWMEKLTAVNPGMKIVDLSNGVDLILEESVPEEVHDGHAHHGHSHYGTDPHIWMSAINARIIAGNIHDELLLMFPGEREYLVTRLTQFYNTLDSLHLEINWRLESLENRKFMIYHPALTYYARDYGLEQYSLEKEGKSPSPSHLMEIIDLAKKNFMDKIFIQSQFDKDNAEVLARESGSELIQFDPLDPNWREQMYYIAEKLNPARQ